MNPWIGVDLDGTLAVYTGWQGPLHIGRPVERMVAHVKRWLENGNEVRIFTARVAEENPLALREILETIDLWCIKHIGRALPVTCKKDYGMVELYDDRCVQVIPNTGNFVGESTRGL